MRTDFRSLLLGVIEGAVHFSGGMPEKDRRLSLDRGTGRLGARNGNSDLAAMKFFFSRGLTPLHADDDPVIHASDTGRDFKVPQTLSDPLSID
jgi:hypothetical protein